MSNLSPHVVEMESQEAIAVRGDVPMAELPAFFERAFTASAEAAHVAGVEIVGPPFGFYPEMPAETVAVEAGFPVSARVDLEGEAHSLTLPAGRAVQVMHIGPFETMEQTYRDLVSWMDAQQLRPASGMWESYLSDPQTDPDPASWQTLIVWPIA